MFKPRTYQDLCNAMQTGAQVEIDRTVGHILSLGREDGSGRRWNVVMLTHTPSLLGKGFQDVPETVSIFFNEPA